MDVVRIKNFNEIKGKILVTTVLNDEILKVLPENISIVYLQNGEGYFPIQREPFWRECVHLIKENTFLDVLKTKGYDSLQFISAASDVTIHPQDIYTISKDYTSFMNRIDNRRFHTSECIFSIDKDGHNILVCTLNLGKGTGSQARSFAENIFSQNLLVAMIKRQEDVYDHSETNI